MQIPLDQINTTLENSIDALDRARAADLGELAAVRSAKFAGLERDRARLVDKLGEQDPRVLALDQKLSQHRALLPVYRMEAALSATVPPKVGERGWALYGNVVDASRAPVEGVTVAVYLGEAWDQRLGHACTDKNGNFALETSDTSKVETRYTLHVLRDGQTIHIDSAPVQVVAGKIEYREVTLDASTAACAPPPGGDATHPPASGSQ